MARLPRYAAPGIPQHVTQRGNNRSALFVADSDYRFFRECLVAACDKYGCHVHAYALMTNHVHLLVTPMTASAIGLVMQSVCRRYVRWFNDTHQRTGTLCEGRYKATVIETKEYLWACHRYVELNPVRAGIVAAPRDYPWSSYRANAHGTNDVLITPHEQYMALGSNPSVRRVAYRALSGEPLSMSMLGMIRDATNGGWVIGSKRFRDEIATLLARRAQPARRRHRRHVNDASGA